MKKSLLLLVAMFIASCSASESAGGGSGSGGNGGSTPPPAPPTGINTPLAIPQNVKTFVANVSDHSKWGNIFGRPVIQVFLRVLDHRAALEGANIFVETSSGTVTFPTLSADAKGRMTGALAPFVNTAADPRSPLSMTTRQVGGKDVLDVKLAKGDESFVLVQVSGSLFVFQGVDASSSEFTESPVKMILNLQFNGVLDSSLFGAEYDQRNSIAGTIIADNGPTEFIIMREKK